MAAAKEALDAMQTGKEFETFAEFKADLQQKSADISALYRIQTSESVRGYIKKHPEVHISEEIR